MHQLSVFSFQVPCTVKVSEGLPPEGNNRFGHGRKRMPLAEQLWKWVRAQPAAPDTNTAFPRALRPKETSASATDASVCLLLSGVGSGCGHSPPEVGAGTARRKWVRAPPAGSGCGHSPPEAGACIARSVEAVILFALVRLDRGIQAADGHQHQQGRQKNAVPL